MEDFSDTYKTLDGTQYSVEQIRGETKETKFRIIHVTLVSFIGWWLVQKRGWFFGLGWDNVSDGTTFKYFDEALENYHQHMIKGK